MFCKYVSSSVNIFIKRILIFKLAKITKFQVFVIMHCNNKFLKGC